eukprot:2761425-Prymnesium_polylepis.1
MPERGGPDLAAPPVCCMVDPCDDVGAGRRPDLPRHQTTPGKQVSRAVGSVRALRVFYSSCPASARDAGVARSFLLPTATALPVVIIEP